MLFLLQHLVIKRHPWIIHLSDYNNQVLLKVRYYSDIHKSFIGANPSSRTTNTFADMNREDALWALEATSNYDYANSYDIVDEIFIDSLKITVENTSENLLNGESLLTAYDQVYNSISEKLNDERVLIVNDMEISNYNEFSTTFRVEIHTGIPLEYAGGKFQAINTFSSSDYWWPFYDQGKCSTYSPDFAGVKDGGDRIGVVLKASWGLPACNGTASFGTDITEVTIEAILPDGFGGYGYYDLYEDDCRTPTEMQTEFDYISPRVVAGRPSGKREKSVDVLESMLFLPEADYGHHVYKIKYANIICTPGGGG